MSKVFVSYSHNDKVFVEDLVGKLESQLIDVWVDWQDIPEGIPWRQAIYDGILASDFFIACVSPSYLESEMCRMEAYLAQAHNKTVLPLMLQECYQDAARYPETKYFPDIHHLDFSGNNIYSKSWSDEERIFNLVSAIKREPHPEETNELYIAFPSGEYLYATQIWEDLNANQVGAWLSTKGYQVGQDWNKRHWQALRRSKVFVPIINVAAAQSFYMKREVLLAKTLGMPMLPILTEEAMSNESLLRKALDESFEMRLLSEIQWFRPAPDYAAMLEKLKKSAQKILSKS